MKKTALLAAALLAATAHADTTLNFRVNLDFASLAGSAPFGLEFDLSGDTNNFGTTSATFTNFVLTGGSFTGASVADGIHSGDLGSTLTLAANNTTPLSYIFRDFDDSVGSIAFDVSVTTDLSLTTAHGLSIYLYDTTDFLNGGTPYVSLDVNGDMAFGDIATSSGSGVTASVTAVPEPSTYGLLGAGAVAAVAAVRRRRKAA